MKTNPHSEVEKLILKEKSRDAEFAKGFEEGWGIFRIGALLAQERERKGISQAEVARRVGTARSNICRWEKKPSNMTIASLAKFAAALGMTPAISLQK